MSYDIRFKVKIEGIDKYVVVGECDANITWNVGEIIRRSTGLPWKNEENNGLVKDVIENICRGREELKRHPEKYRQYEAPNGWGTVKGTIRFFESIYNAWIRLLAYEGEEIANVATFWIE